MQKKYEDVRSINESKAKKAGQIVEERINEKNKRPTLGGVLDSVPDDRNICVSRGNEIIAVGRAIQLRKSVDPFQKTFKIKGTTEMTTLYIEV